MSNSDMQENVCESRTSGIIFARPCRSRSFFQPVFHPSPDFKSHSTKFKSTLLTSLTALAGFANAGVVPVTILLMLPVPQGIFSMRLEERKLPLLDKDVITKAASFVPMLIAEFVRAVATRH